MGAVDLASLRQSITRSGAQEEYLTDSEVWGWSPTLASLEALQLEIVEGDIQVRGEPCFVSRVGGLVV